MPDPCAAAAQPAQQNVRRVWPTVHRRRRRVRRRLAAVETRRVREWHRLRSRRRPSPLPLLSAAPVAGQAHGTLLLRRRPSMRQAPSAGASCRPSRGSRSSGVAIRQPTANGCSRQSASRCGARRVAQRQLQRRMRDRSPLTGISSVRPVTDPQDRAELPLLGVSAPRSLTCTVRSAARVGDKIVVATVRPRRTAARRRRSRRQRQCHQQPHHGLPPGERGLSIASGPKNCCRPRRAGCRRVERTFEAQSMPSAAPLPRRSHRDRCDTTSPAPAATALASVAMRSARPACRHSVMRSAGAVAPCWRACSV